MAYIVHESNIEITSIEDSRLRPTIRHFDLAAVALAGELADHIIDN